jgi:type IV pilus assembly protein PilX
MKTAHTPFRPRALRSTQRGISLLFALMALVILGFGAVALTRSVDTGTLIMGNLAFKQDTLAASSSGAEKAINWLKTQLDTPGTAVALNGDINNHGYYAAAIDKLDVTATRTSSTNKLPTVNWDGDCNGLPSGAFETCEFAPYAEPDRVNGNKIQWLITRLCDKAEVPSGTNPCVRPPAASTSTASERGELQPGGRISRGVASPYYRIIVRVEGPRNTVSYTESLVHF